MKEVYRIFHYNNGYKLSIANVIDILEHQDGTIKVTSLDGEIIVVKPGWIATTFKVFVPPVPAPVPQADGDSSRD